MELKLTKTFLLDTWLFFRSNFNYIILIVFPFTIPLEIFSFVYYEFLAEDEGGLAPFIPELFYLFFYPIFNAALVFFVASVIKGRSITATQAWGLGIKYWPSYFVLTVILILVVGFGFAIFIFPGLILAARLAFSEFDLLIKNESVGQSLKSSWKSSKEYFWVLLNGGLVITFVIYAPYFLIFSILSEIGLYSEILYLILSIIESALMALYTIYAFRVYDFSNQQHNKQRKADA
ncbi:MAG: hypothetical protein ACI92N_002160 [Pseudomonadales bacterium]|jgi:hypothetical protein